MKKDMKRKKSAFKSILIAVAGAALLSCTSSSYGDKKNDCNVDKINIPDVEIKNSDIPSFKTVADMKFGWNLGNTLDACDADSGTDNNKGLSTETCWGQPVTTKEMIKKLSESGVKTLRIPVSYHNHITDKANYTIDEKWLNRIKTVVDYAKEEDMYVIINIHHDTSFTSNLSNGFGYYPNKENKDVSLKFVSCIWTQVSRIFKDYDEKLIFEVLNEPRLRGHSCEWWYNGCNECRECMEVLNELNQKCVDTIRSEEGQNKTRLIMIPSIAASPDAAFSDTFRMPKDISGNSNRLILSVHMYTPYEFAMKSPGDTKLTINHQNTLLYYFGKLKENFLDKGYPVVIGEMGATNKNNLQDRIAWMEVFTGLCKAYGICPILWDNGSFYVNGTDYNEHFGFFNRKALSWYFPEITDAAINTWK